MIITRKVRQKFSKSKYKVTLGIVVTTRIRCSDNSGAKVLFVIGVFKSGSRLNKIPGACAGSMVIASVKKGKTKLRKSSKS